MQKESFIEKFAKIYEYPYGTGFTKGITDKLAAYLLKNSKAQAEPSNPLESISKRLQNYYEGYEDSSILLTQHKAQFEKERFMNVRHPEFTHTYDRYLQYLDEEDILEYRSQLKAERKQCVYCHKFYYGNPMAKLNSNVSTDQPDLCELCCKKYISGLFDSGSENKKIARYLGHPLVVKSKIGVNQTQGSNQDSSSVDQSLIEQPKESNKRQRKAESPAKGSKRQKVQEEEEEKILKCTTVISKIYEFLLNKTLTFIILSILHLNLDSSLL